jgi:hypothetical protein
VGAILDVFHSGTLMLVDEQLAAFEKSAGAAYWTVKAILLQDAGAI